MLDYALVNKFAVKYRMCNIPLRSDSFANSVKNVAKTDKGGLCSKCGLRVNEDDSKV